MGRSYRRVAYNERLLRVETSPLDLGPVNGRNRCCSLIDRRHVKVWIAMSQPPLTQRGSHPGEQFPPSSGMFLMSAFLIWAASP